MTGEPLRHLQSASGALLEGLKGEDRAALVTFSPALMAALYSRSAQEGTR